MGKFGAPGNRARPVASRLDLPSQALIETIKARQAEREGAQVSFLDWALKVPEPKAGKLDFSPGTGYPWQVELYARPADKEQVIKKCTQVGISAYLLRWAMYWPDLHPVNALYVFPRARQMYDFSAARIGRAVRASEYLMTRVRDTDNLGLKAIGVGFLYLRGSEAVEQLDSVDADVLALDEYDTLKTENIPDAERRISGSRLGLIRRVGVPSIPGWGIDKLYKQSDQRDWHVRCEACGTWQELLFPDNVDVTTAKVICRKDTCRKPLNVNSGEWVAAYPEREVRGYHMNRLMISHTNVRQIIEASKKTGPRDVQVHHNKDLGLAYAPETGRLSPEAIMAAQRNYQLHYENGGLVVRSDGYSGGDLVTMGIDVASSRNLNVRVSHHFNESQKRALFIGEVAGFEDLDPLMEQFDVKMAAIDNMPERRMAQAFSERFPGRVYLVRYGSPQGRIFEVDDTQRMITVRRVETIDAAYELIRKQRNLLPGIQLDGLPTGYVEQMGALVRRDEEDEVGKRVTEYVKTADRDDYSHAEGYDIVATEAFWYRQGMDEATAEQYTPLDDMLDFERAGLDFERELHPGTMEPLGAEPSFQQGPGDDEYYPGHFGDL